MTELSQATGVSMPLMTGMADRLVKSKMVKRKRDHIDRRVIKMWLTDTGRETLKNWWESEGRKWRRC